MRSTRNRLIMLRAMLTCTIVPMLVAPVLAQDQPGRVDWELATNRDYVGPVQRAAIDVERRTAYLATMVNLYEVRDGKAQPIAKRPAPEAQLVLAPGGTMYAWLVPDKELQGLYLVHLMDISGKKVAELRLEKPPYGFGGLHLGFQGRLIVTVTALDDWQGVRGRLQYTFWNRDGRMLKALVRPTREIGVVGADGESFLLLGQKEASAYSAAGEQLWRLEGQFRKGALALGGKLALLNPAPREKIEQVYVFAGSGRPTVVKVPTPVHHLRIAPDGSVAVVGGDLGRYFYLNPASGELTEGTRLPFDAPLFIADIGLVNADTLALGVLQSQGDPPQHTWPRGSIVVVNRKGEVAFRKGFPIREPLASRPAIDVTFGLTTFVGFTLDTAILVNLGR